MQYWLANLAQIFAVKRTEIIKIHCSDNLKDLSFDQINFYSDVDLVYSFVHEGK